MPASLYALALDLAVLTALPLLIRPRAGRHQFAIDLITVLTIFLVRHSHVVVHILPIVSHWSSSFNQFVVIGSLAVGLLFYLFGQGSRQKSWPLTSDQESGFQPLFFPCRTTHRRFFPKKHVFEYSYLLAGIPIGWQGSAGTLLSADNSSTQAPAQRPRPRRTWFRVEGNDYLRRGPHSGGLKGKLLEYFHNHGIDADRYPYAYLLTAPRFMGAAFNPVSFWYLYTAERHLEAMILEVNNTFDERRMYFVELVAEDRGTKNAAGSFKQNFYKDFHVSPFNQRDGTYTVKTTDPLALQRGGRCWVDINVVLRSSEGKAVLDGRVFSTVPPIDPAQTKGRAAALFLFQWCWVGFLTIPRIMKEARKIWSKGLKIIRRPEVHVGSLGRTATSEERTIEVEFSKFLQRNAEQSTSPVAYTAAAGPHCNIVQYFNVDPDHKDRPSLEVHVLTPSFYTELVRSGSVAETVKRLAFLAPDRERMLHVSDERLWDDMVATTPHARPASKDQTPNPLLWKMMKLTRMFNVSASSKVIWDALRKRATREKRLSELDVFVIDYDKAAATDYIKACLTTLISDRLAFGRPSLLRMYAAVLWIVLCLVASHALGVNVDVDGQNGVEVIWRGTYLIPPLFIALLRDGVVK